MFKKVFILCGLLMSVIAFSSESTVSTAFKRISYTLADGFQETPAAIFTTGRAALILIDRGDEGIEYIFRFNDLQGDIEQSVGAHIHFGRPGINGGIMVFICGTAAVAGPPGTPECLSDGQGSGTVSGLIIPDSVLPIADQNFPGQDLDALRRAIRSGSAYLNVHTDAFPTGEIRGNIGARRYH